MKKLDIFLLGVMPVFWFYCWFFECGYSLTVAMFLTGFFTLPPYIVITTEIRAHEFRQFVKVTHMNYELEKAREKQS
jgi:hypothetical protein